MTHVIKVRNVEQAIGEGFAWLKCAGADTPSRNGPVRVAPGPVVTEYAHPRERVLFNPERDANPVFHLLESIWMLAGRDESKFLLPYNARMAEYAEEDGDIHGAYGYRWRKFFGLDQIHEIIDMIKKQPNTRRAVLGMWSAAADLGVEKRDLPCNTHVYFNLQSENGGPQVLDMTVCCRSNDALWGAYGANAVHFSMLQELIAHGVGTDVGVYRQFSNNFHAYTAHPTVRRWLVSNQQHSGAYPHPIVPMLLPSETVEDFLQDAETLVFGREANGLATSFFHRVVVPLKNVYDARKVGARTWKVQLDGVVDCDWKQAFVEWAERREPSLREGAAQ